MTVNDIDSADNDNWSRSAEDIAEFEADLADTESGPPPGRSFARDFRRAPSITIAEWRMLKAKRVKRRTPTRSRPRAARCTPKVHSAPSAQVIDGGPTDTEPPPPPASLSRVANEYCDLSVVSAAIASAAATEVLPLSDRERRLIDFLVDEALNEWWKQNSRD